MSILAQVGKLPNADVIRQELLPVATSNTFLRLLRERMQEISTNLSNFRFDENDEQNLKFARQYHDLTIERDVLFELVSELNKIEFHFNPTEAGAE